jgi:hypothetical protein
VTRDPGTPGLRPEQPAGPGADLAAANAPTDADLAQMLAEIDRDHEAMRLRILELLRLLEDAVTAQVAGERRVAELTEQCARLQAEVDALHDTKLFRAARPVRAAYSRIRSVGRSAP